MLNIQPDKETPIIVDLPAPTPGQRCVITTDGSVPVIIRPPTSETVSLDKKGDRWDSDQ